MHFGTDGIRGEASIFQEKYLKKIALATLAVKPNSKIIIGRDTRVSGLKIENNLKETFLNYGAKVVLVGIVPTPALAFLTKKLNCDFGIMLSASHNPPEYNGIKYFSETGEKISDTIEKKIEYYIDNPKDIEKQEICKVQYYFGDNDYLDFLINALSPNIKNMKICLDCANGATSNIAPMLFAKLGAKVYAFNTELDGKRINVGCGATNPEFLLNKMREEDFDIGFSYDGDGDRLIVVQNSKIFNGDHIMYLHAKNMKQKGKLHKNVLVGTIMSNKGTEIACEKSGITLIRTNVGDKFVHRKMMENGYNLGGEESGHIIFSDYMKTGDGILSSLLTAMLAKEISLFDEDDIFEFPVVSDCYVCDNEKKQRFLKDEEIKKYIDELKFDGRCVVRPSGTEPKIRIMVEAVDKSEATEKVKQIKDFIMWRLS